MFLYPNSLDPFLRNSNIGLDDIFSYSSEIRYGVTEVFVVGLSIEYLQKKEFGRNLTIGTQRIEVEDGFRVYPIELSVYYILPFSTEYFKFFMGGGGGIYIGEHLRKFGDAEVTNVSRKFAYGIQVGVGMDYMITDYFSVRGELKFRDPEFEMTSKYSSKTINYFGTTYILSNEQFDSKVNIDGITFMAGIVFHL